VRAQDDDHQPSWKRPFTPVQLPPGASLSRAVRDAADAAGVP